MTNDCFGKLCLLRFGHFEDVEACMHLHGVRVRKLFWSYLRELQWFSVPSPAVKRVEKFRDIGKKKHPKQWFAEKPLSPATPRRYYRSSKRRKQEAFGQIPLTPNIWGQLKLRHERISSWYEKRENEERRGVIRGTATWPGQQIISKISSHQPRHWALCSDQSYIRNSRSKNRV